MHRQRFFGGGGRQSSYHIPLTKPQAIENRDAVSKEIYSRLFNFLVARLNIALGANKNDQNFFIGILFEARYIIRFDDGNCSRCVRHLRL